MTTTLTGWRTPADRAGALADCSLVVATFRRPDDVRALIARLLALGEPPAEVVVVDGAPDGATERALRDAVRAAGRAFDVLYVRSPAGLTRQRNVGIDASRGAFVFFLDDDCLPEDGYFAAIRACFLEGGESVGGVCGFVVNEVGRPLSRRWRARLALRIVPRMEAGAYDPIGASMPYAVGTPFAGCRPVAVMPGCAMAFRRSVLERQRFSSYFSGYAQGEDLEMSLRVGREHALRWSGAARAHHLQSPGGRPGTAEKARMEIRNRHFIWRRYSPHPPVVERLRFWGDVAFSLSWDAATFLSRPTSLAPLRHAAGALLGAAQCLVAPPHHEEPPARREYDVLLEDAPADAPRPARAPGSANAVQEAAR